MPRPTNRNLRRSPERMSPDRESWVDLGRFQVLLFDGHGEGVADGNPEDEGHGSDLPQYKIAIRFPGRPRPTSLNLVALTVPELDALEQFFIRAFQLVRPVCEQLDERAKTAFEEGDETYVRLYRPVPQLHVRKERGETRHSVNRPVSEFDVRDGTQSEQRSGVPERPGGTVEVHGQAGGLESGSGGKPGSSVPDLSEGNSSTEDDPSQAGGVPSVGEVPRERSLSEGLQATDTTEA